MRACLLGVCMRENSKAFMPAQQSIHANTAQHSCQHSTAFLAAQYSIPGSIIS